MDEGFARETFPLELTVFQREALEGMLNAFASGASGASGEYDLRWPSVAYEILKQVKASESGRVRG